MTDKHWMKKHALNVPRLILLSILDFVSCTPIWVNISAKSEFEIPLLTNSDFSKRFTLLFQSDINNVFAKMTIYWHICKHIFQKL